MSYRQVMGWQAYESLEPFERRRADVHAAMIVQAVANQMRSEDDDPVKLEEVFPRFGESTRAKEEREKRRAQKATEKVQRLLGGG